ncbi:major facilitator superfamily domain-containing protein [Aspergillus alliaceus]|uniref:major facilitator superfamily domain-containing protein n=1 Tax=Petromyces alliaceus TaxID=209559 RepID=UPI0012A3D35F|nr:major facilitator superfamily domain-containing protein [Aspergillus alliaceus]KAB8232502.1 major facilitator superfamily domain-containing protein [Aspergillus alliaceus]
MADGKRDEENGARQLLGTGVGPIIVGPMSEVVGRRIIYNRANIGFCAFTVGCALTPSLLGLVILRFLQGCSASCSLNNAGGTISDLVPIHRRGLAMTMYSAGWRWVFWLWLILNGTMGIFCAFTYTETYAPVILKRKVKTLRQKTGNQALYANGQRQLPANTVLKRAITSPVKMFLFCSVVTGLAVYNAVIYGFTYLLFSTFSVVLEDQYGFNQGRLGMVYLGLTIGFLVSLTKSRGAAKPEFRLESLVYGAIAILIEFFIYEWTVQYHFDSAVPVVATGIVGFGVMFTFIPFNVYMIDAYTKYAASAITAGNILRSLSAALLPLVGASLYNNLGYGWGNSLLAFVSLALGAMCLLFLKYGEEWRREFSIQLH